MLPKDLIDCFLMFINTELFRDKFIVDSFYAFIARGEKII